MWSKRSVLDAVLLFALSLPGLFLITRLGPQYGAPFAGGLAAGLASGHVLLCALNELWRLPPRWKILGGLAAVIVFWAPFPAGFLRRWPHSGIGFSLGIFTIGFLEMSILSLQRGTKPNATSDALQNDPSPTDS